MSMCFCFLHIGLSHEVSSSNEGIFESHIFCLPVDISVFVAVWLCSSSYFFLVLHCLLNKQFSITLFADDVN